MCRASTANIAQASGARASTEYAAELAAADDTVEEAAPELHPAGTLNPDVLIDGFEPPAVRSLRQMPMCPPIWRAEC